MSDVIADFIDFWNIRKQGSILMLEFIYHWFCAVKTVSKQYDIKKYMTETSDFICLIRKYQTQLI